MCLAVPGRVVDWLDRQSPLAIALVEFDGVRHPISLACIDEIQIGEYVLAHAGIAISKIDSQEADQLLQTLKEIEEHPFEDLRESDDPGRDHKE